jgi:hypothetical protein
VVLPVTVLLVIMSTVDQIEGLYPVVVVVSGAFQTKRIVGLIVLVAAVLNLDAGVVIDT